MGFFITHTDKQTKRHQHEYINTSNDFVMIGENLWKDNACFITNVQINYIFNNQQVHDK